MRTRLLIPGLVMLCLQGCSLFRWRLDDEVRESPFWSEPPAGWSAPRDVTVVTYNVHDLMWITDHREERLREIGRRLAQLGPDVVCVQEGFVRGDVAGLTEELADAGLGHVQTFPSGALGSGLWTYSRFPIEEAWFWKFTENGHWWEFRQGDWWAGKGVGLTRLRVADGEYLDVYNTHFIAGYGGDGNQEDRWVQAGEMARFVRRAEVDTIPSLLLGDFNAGPGRDAYQALVQMLSLQPLPEPGWLDHVFFRPRNGVYDAEVLATESVHGYVEVDGEEAQLSDHSGKVVQVRLAPTTKGTP